MTRCYDCHGPRYENLHRYKVGLAYRAGYGFYVYDAVPVCLPCWRTS